MSFYFYPRPFRQPQLSSLTTTYPISFKEQSYIPLFIPLIVSTSVSIASVILPPLQPRIRSLSKIPYSSTQFYFAILIHVSFADSIRLPSLQFSAPTRSLSQQQNAFFYVNPPFSSSSTSNSSDILTSTIPLSILQYTLT